MSFINSTVLFTILARLLLVGTWVHIGWHVGSYLAWHRFAAMRLVGSWVHIEEQVNHYWHRFVAKKVRNT